MSAARTSVASSMSIAASMPSSAPSTAPIMYWPSLLRGAWMPGVSRKTICASSFVITPMMRLRVVCARGETMATFSPTSAFISVDLPTFGRPRITTNPERNPFFFSMSLFFSCPMCCEIPAPVLCLPRFALDRARGEAGRRCAPPRKGGAPAP